MNYSSYGQSDLWKLLKKKDYCAFLPFFVIYLSYGNKLKFYFDRWSLVSYKGHTRDVHVGSGNFFFEDFVKLHEFAQDLSFYKWNIQKLDESDGFNLVELI
jgi:hypothetical protein